MGSALSIAEISHPLEIYKLNLRKAQLTGCIGENEVARALTQQKWTILERNFRHIGSEIDIIARKGATLIFVEVKTTRKCLANLALIEKLLPMKKRRSISLGISHYLQRNEQKEIESIRIDLALVRLNSSGKKTTIQWIANVTPVIEMD